MRYLRQNTATKVTVGPFLDAADGKTPKIALTATNEGITFIVDDQGSPLASVLVIDTTATSAGGDNDLVHVTSDAAGYYTLELTAAQTNYVGRAVLAINYATDHLPVWHEFEILPANVYDSLRGTDYLDVAVSTGGIAAASFASGAIDATALATTAATEIRDAIMAAVVESQGTYTVQQVLSIMLAVLAGVTSSGGTVLKSPNGSATRVQATVNASNERTAMTLSPSS